MFHVPFRAAGLPASIPRAARSISGCDVSFGRAVKGSGIGPGPQVFGRVDHAAAEATETRAVSLKTHTFEGPGRQAQMLCGFRLGEVGKCGQRLLHRCAARMRRMDV